MSDRMTPEQREKLLQWKQAQTDMPTPPVHSTEHLRRELGYLARGASDLMQGQALIFYALAIVDMEHFLETGNPLRDLEPDERFRRAHELMIDITLNMME